MMKNVKKAGLCLFLGTMMVTFAAASYHLGLSVLTSRVEDLMTGGFLMFAAMGLAWLRLATYDSTDAPEGATPVGWTSHMDTEAA